MNQKTVWQLFADLPPEAQRQVTDFIEFLQMRYPPSRRRQTAKQIRLVDETFVGMWRNREDLRDSSAWVREVRQREWAKPHG